MNQKLTTPRLLLRSWKDEDYEPFFGLNSDPQVMEYFPNVLTRKESDRLALRLRNSVNEKGWGFFAAELKSTGDFIGLIGINPVSFFKEPVVEVGWRLGLEYWGKGLATEGAKAALKFGFEELNLAEIVSFTSVKNKRSQSVMKKLGMTHDPKDDFNHPHLLLEHPLSRHVLYKLNQSQWQSNE